MSLANGTRLGAYEILAPIGAGGMGEVYRATDTRIDRTVAIKVLPSSLADNAELKQRFEREAKSISSLNHPHICTLYEFDSHEGTDFLVMEHLEGESLAERIRRKGALPLDEALRYAVQIAEALDVAHRQGVVHRDLKPGNIMLTARGAMLLDFGLAKLAEPGASPDLSVLSAVPTQAQPLTEKGAILGTFQYMAPEQLEGSDVDARTDVFAFGAVVHEMVTGKKAFEGKSQASLIGAILERDPTPVSSLRPLAPSGLDRIVKKCLAKNPADRYYSTHDLADELRWLGQREDFAPVSVSADTSRLRGRVGLAIAILIGALVGAATLWSVLPRTSPGHVMRFAVDLPSGESLVGSQYQKIAVAPDGTRLAFAVDGRIFVRELGELEARPLPGTEGDPHSLAFSPDGAWIAFWEDGELKKVAVAGGAPLRLCEVEVPYGIVWDTDDAIRFGSRSSGIQEISASGGVPDLILDPGGPVWRPQRLPDGQSYLFAMGDGPTIGQYRLAVMKPGDEAPRVLFEGSDNVQLLASGQLLFTGTSDDLLAAAFDPSRLELAGAPVPVVEGATWQFDVARDGTLVYVPLTGLGEFRLVWVDRQGTVSTAVDERRAFNRPQLSPDGGRAVVEVGHAGGNRDLWVYDLERGTRTRLTSAPVSESDPIWAPDGGRIFFNVEFALYAKPADGSGAELVVSREDFEGGDPYSVSTDGKLLAYYVRKGTPRVHRDIWTLDLESGEREPFVVTEFNERSPSFSPDGSFIAYASDASGRDEVYVQPYPGPGPLTVVSTDGGREPLWSRAGDELFYRSGDRMMAVSIETSPRFRAGTPRVLFEGPFREETARGSGSHTYDVSPDGERFLMVELGDSESKLHVVVNWFEELESRVPTGR